MFAWLNFSRKSINFSPIQSGFNGKHDENNPCLFPPSTKVPTSPSRLPSLLLPPPRGSAVRVRSRVNVGLGRTHSCLYTKKRCLPARPFYGLVAIVKRGRRSPCHFARIHNVSRTGRRARPCRRCRRISRDSGVFIDSHFGRPVCFVFSPHKSY